ncbi:hypothetical protein [Lentzea albidocapillata]|uniref:Uncharacterized protein n=1 Tax=Lentzea albidocapillata TaxID=40571 RepID=A0A1W2DDT3_9PSEU|nr:hypothetical protein [Lentzea albidocapillata]SMC95665.1 hypothetical protein SAMN05660733_02907 [Lentzea albidocapillata]
MNDNMIRLPGHPILGVGDLVHYDASFAGDLPVKIVGLMPTYKHGCDVIKVQLMTTFRLARNCFEPRELITAEPTNVLPRTGWRTLSSPFHKRHALGWCLAWEACSSCGRESRQTTGGTPPHQPLSARPRR